MEHSFAPTAYHPTLGSHLPVLRVAPGDTVTTTTLDAFGRDANGDLIGPPGNPQTGPFYIETAEPGDTLAVHFDRIWPNRDYGMYSTRIAPHILDPWHQSKVPAGQRVDFKIDHAAKTATLSADIPTLGSLTVPVDPMLGCFGVAPARGQAISTATSGPYGGNMDYRGFRSGVTAYLPVFVEGALFHLGDGHAWQADGEILGTGIEIPMEVTFTVRVFKEKRIGWPRGQNDTHILTVGNARPLDQAVQHATTEMLNWLQEDYGLQEAAAHVLLGTFIEYDLGNVFDPAFTMVTKLSKSVLPPAVPNALIPG